MTQARQWPPPFYEQWADEVDKEAEPDMLLDPFYPADSNIWVTGRAKSRKSLFVMATAICLTAGKSFGLLKVKEPIAVAMLEFEGGAKRTLQRMRKIGRGLGLEPNAGLLSWVHRYPMLITQAGWRDKLLRLIEERNIKLMVIDTMRKATAGDENRAEDVNSAMRVVDLFRNAGCGCVYVHHTHKPKEIEEDIDDEGAGSNSYAGWYDVHLAFRKEGDAHILKVRERDGKERIYAVDWTFDEKANNLDLREFDPENVPKAVLLACYEALEKDKQYSFAAMMRLWSVPKDMANAILAQLIEGGLLQRAGKGFKPV